jgi:hypothetical protein
LFDPEDKDFMEQYQKWQNVQSFFDSFRNPYGSIRHSHQEMDWLTERWQRRFPQLEHKEIGYGTFQASSKDRGDTFTLTL